MQTVIDCQGLSKRYASSKIYSLHDLTLTVDAGEVYGFLGPNGAGKSTAIRTLLNFIQPTNGSATICGLDVVRDSVAVKQHIGYLSGEVALYDQMTGRQIFDYLVALQPLKHHEYLDELIESFKATLDKPMNELSKGNRQKIGVIQAFMHEPDVLILDEPTSGLDPLMQAVFYRTVQSAKARGAAIFLSSHDLSEVRKMCDRIGFIRDGELVSEQTIDDLRSKAAHSFDITFTGKAPLATLKKIPGAIVTVMSEGMINIKIQGGLTPLFQVLAKANVLALDKHDVNLEEAFLGLYQNTGDKVV